MTILIINHILMASLGPKVGAFVFMLELANNTRYWDLCEQNVYGLGFVVHV